MKCIKNHVLSCAHERKQLEISVCMCLCTPPLNVNTLHSQTRKIPYVDYEQARVSFNYMGFRYQHPKELVRMVNGKETRSIFRACMRARTHTPIPVHKNTYITISASWKVFFFSFIINSNLSCSFPCLLFLHFGFSNKMSNFVAYEKCFN